MVVKHVDPVKKVRRASDGDAALDFDAYVPSLIVRLASKLTANAVPYYRENRGIALGEWRILHALGAESGISASRIAERIDLDKAAVSRGLRTLEERGLVRVELEEPRSRSLQAFLTPEGRTLHGEILTDSLRREEHLLAPLNACERSLLIGIIWTLMDNVAAMDRPQDRA